MARGGPFAPELDGNLELGRAARARISQLVGGNTGDGRRGLLPQTPIDLDARQLGTPGNGNQHRPKALDESGRASSLDWLRTSGRHLGVRKHRERSQPMAGDRTDSDPAFGVGEAICGAAGCHVVLALETQCRRSEAVVATSTFGLVDLLPF